MLFRTRRVRKKYFKLKKKYNVHFFKKIQRNRLRNWHIYHRLKKLKYNYLYQNLLPFSKYTISLTYGKINYIQKTFKESLSLSSEYRLIFQNFIKDKFIFKKYETYYNNTNLNTHLSHVNICRSSNLFFSFFVVKSKVRVLLNIFNYFTNYFIINCKSDSCYLVYSINGLLNEFFLFYFLYLRHVFSSPDFEDIIFFDLNYNDFWFIILKQYFILNQFYCCMLKYKNIENFGLLLKDFSKLEVFEDRDSSEKSKDELEESKIFENFELEESENMLLDDYILYNKNDDLTLLNKKDLSSFSEDNLCPIILADNENYLKFSLTILKNIDDFFLNNLEYLEK